MLLVVAVLLVEYATFTSAGLSDMANISQAYSQGTESMLVQAYADSFALQNLSVGYLNYTAASGALRVSGIGGEYVISTPEGEYVIRGQ